MIANLYLHTESFKYNGTNSSDEVATKIKRLIEDMRDVIYNSSNENVFKVPTQIYNCPIFKEQTIVDFANAYLDGEQQVLMYSVLGNTSDDYSLTYEELEQKCLYQENETEINSILILNRRKDDEEKNADKKEPYIQFDKYKIIYDLLSWKTLRRQIIGNHPGTPTEFIGECRKYFDILDIHNNCIKSLEEDNYLETIPRKIVYYLSCLNDGFYSVMRRHTDKEEDANSILADFSGEYGLDEPGSLERNPEKKPSLTFCFKIKDKDGNNHEHKILCEPHLKISQPDASYKGSSINYLKFHPRIYFKFNYPNAPEKIFIGSIGPHL